MRIVAGAFRGRSVQAPAGEGTRPTTDRVREALFSSLYSLRGGFEGAVVLDAFAGSGALGIEALSRGAAQAVFYENDAKAAAVLKRNLASLGLGAADARDAARNVAGGAHATPQTAQEQRARNLAGGASAKPSPGKSQVARIVARDVLAAPPTAQRPPFDLVFLDPPYSMAADDVLSLVSALREAGGLEQGALVVYEHDVKTRAAVADSANTAGFALRTSKKYGKTAVDILARTVR